MAVLCKGALLTGNVRYHLLSGYVFAVKTKPVSQKVDIKAIESLPVDSIVEVQATVKSISRPREGSKAPYKITIADETGSITLIVWQDAFEVLQSQFDLGTGDTIRAEARVTEFRNERQLTLRNVADLSVKSKGETPLAAAAKPPVPVPETKPRTSLGSITQSMTGQVVTVQATISDVREPSSERAPFIVTLSEGNSRIPLVFWSDVQSEIASQIRVGNAIRAKVLVNEYRGTLQLKLRDAKDLESAGAEAETREAGAPPAVPAAAPEPKDSKASIGSITEAWVNRTVTISGSIAASDSIGKGQRLRLRDATGEIQVILWDTVLSRIPAEEFRLGRSVSVTGTVKLYRGKVEVIPDSADSVKFLAD
jgi:DNA/RNA endonuclease YhcR with UshA esterase domain